MAFKLADHIAWQQLKDEVIIIDIPGLNALGLNPPGSFVWSLLGEHDEATIAEKLASRFGITLAQASNDVSVFLAEMKTRGLITVAT